MSDDKINKDNEGHQLSQEAKRCSDDAEYTKLNEYFTLGKHVALLTNRRSRVQIQQHVHVRHWHQGCVEGDKWRKWKYQHGWLCVMSCLHHNVTVYTGRNKHNRGGGGGGRRGERGIYMEAKTSGLTREIRGHSTVCVRPFIHQCLSVACLFMPQYKALWDHLGCGRVQHHSLTWDAWYGCERMAEVPSVKWGVEEDAY